MALREVTAWLGPKAVPPSRNWTLEAVGAGAPAVCSTYWSGTAVPTATEGEDVDTTPMVFRLLTVSVNVVDVCAKAGANVPSPSRQPRCCRLRLYIWSP